jgi:hypothetical protein
MAYNPQNPNGQKIMDNSAPVVIASDQTAIPITGTITSTPSGTQTVSGSVSVSNFPATQAVSATDLDIRNLVFATDRVDISGSSNVAVTGPLTDAQLRATPVPVSGTVTANAGTGNFTVVQGTATNLRTVAEIYQGGNPLSPTNELFVDTTMDAVKTYHTVSAATNNAFRIKGGASKVYGWYIYNNADTARRVVLYDSNANPPVPSTATIRLVLTIPAFSGANASFPFGIEFVDGLGIATLLNISDTDYSPLTVVNELNINIFYK